LSIELDRDAAAAGAAVERVRGEGRRERLGPERGDERVRRGVARHPEHRAEAPGVVVAQRRPVVEHEVDVIVRLPGRRAAVQAQAAGHAQVDEQRAFAVRRPAGRGHSEEQVLASAVDCRDGSPAEPSLQPRRNRPAQPAVVDMHGGHAAAGESGRDAAADGLDFGQFGHVVRLRPRALRSRLARLLGRGL
jgi:hypothetical protein